MAIATVERLAEKQAHRHHRSLRNCAKLLDLVASLNSPKLRAGCSCGVPNLHLAAVANLYLAVVHKMRGDDGGAARHLLQIFCDVPHLARKSLLPELWENFFLPHLVQLEKWLYRAYSDQMDLGTMQLAIHYKQCIQSGDLSLAAPPVPLPPAGGYHAGSGKRSVSVPPSSLAQNPYRGDLKHGVPGKSNPNGGPASRRATPEKPRSSGNSIPRAPFLDLDRAISSISTSNNLGECELAVGVISKVWIEFHGDPAVAAALSTAPVVEGLLEVLFASNDEAISELAMAEGRSARRSAAETFLKLFRTRGLFLKAAVLLYLTANSGRSYFLFSTAQLGGVLLPRPAPPGFDVDRNTENAKQVVALGGLGMLLRRFEEGDDRQMYSATHLLVTCVRAEESCMEFLAERMKKASVMELLTGNRAKSRSVLCPCWRTQVRSFLDDLKNEGCLNAMHILLVYLQQAPAEQRPLAAAILLQIDLLGDPLQYSVHREEAIDALVEAMDRSSRRKVQESCSRALCLLCGRFSRNGEASMEAWLLRKAGLDNPPRTPPVGKRSWRMKSQAWYAPFLHRGPLGLGMVASDTQLAGLPELRSSRRRKGSGCLLPPKPHQKLRMPPKASAFGPAISGSDVRAESLPPVMMDTVIHSDGDLCLVITPY
ncbi:unnamed protein product [Spirodela intermedia]|uniref:Uncharacterized protein n=1 Tax=Spirodela intermedia TaxID=51605 RepID=A0A7I8JP18_SPIIN|nr:unnamed protein product [Spirodela intermedia]CAA6671850.1 unnamed protein product [Spirodela intermedia]